MTGRLNQDLPDTLQTAFEKAVSFEPRIIMKQSINERRVHEIHNIELTCNQEEIKVNEAHVKNPNYKGKNYDPNYQQNRMKQILAHTQIRHTMVIHNTNIATQKQHTDITTLNARISTTTRQTNRTNQSMFW